MFTIRKEQKDAFSKNLENVFVARMAEHLRNNYSNELKAIEVKSNQVESLVQKGMDNARGYGVIYEDDIQFYLECMVLLNPNFDKNENYSWAGEILNRDDLNGEDKMGKINQYMIYQIEEPLTDEPD